MTGATDVRIRRYTIVLAGLALLLVAWQVSHYAGVLASLSGFFVSALYDGNAFLGMAMAGALLIHLWTRPGIVETVVTCLFGGGLEIGCAWIRSRHGMTVPGIIENLGLGLGIASLLVLCVRIALGANRRATVATLLAVLVLPVFVTLSFPFVSLTALYHPETYDLAAYAVDGMLGLQASFVAGRVFAEQVWLRVISGGVYAALPVGFALVYAVQARDQKPNTVDVLIPFIAAGAAGFCLYHLLPIVGPAFMFKATYPVFAPPVPSVEPMTVASPVFRNCMPSLHTAWALLMWWYARPHARWVRITTGLWLLLTELATLGFGWHYVIDLVVAVPFACAVQGAVSLSLPWRHRLRLVALGAGSILTLAWMLALRFTPGIFLVSSVLTWLLVLLTVAVAVWLERRLWYAAHPPPASSAA